MSCTVSPKPAGTEVIRNSVLLAQRSSAWLQTGLHVMKQDLCVFQRTFSISPYTTSTDEPVYGKDSRSVMAIQHPQQFSVDFARA